MASPFAIQSVDGTIPANSNQSDAVIAPTVSGYTFRFWISVVSVGFSAPIYTSYPTSKSATAWASSSSTSVRAIRFWALYTKDI